MNITVVGSGYVGLVTGVCLAELGNKVTCIDTNESIIKKLRNAKVPFYEPGLDQMLLNAINSNCIKFTVCHGFSFIFSLPNTHYRRIYFRYHTFV